MSKLIDKVWDDQDKFLKQFDIIKVPRGGLDKPGVEGLEFLFNKIKHRDVRIVELGSWTGCSSIVLGTLAKKHNGKVTCVDWFEGSKDSNLGCAKYINTKAIFLDNIEQAGLKDVIKLEQCDCSYLNIHPNTADLVFVDADHRYENVKRDIDTCWGIVKPGGILCGHDCEYLIKGYDDLFRQTEQVDYTQCHTGVIRAVYEAFGDRAKITDGGYIWWVQKDDTR